MNRRITELEANTTITSFFALASLREARTRTGSSFYNLLLQDRTGTASGKVWSPAEVWRDDIVVPGVVKVRARVETYRDEIQLNIEAIEPYRPTAEEYDALMPCSRWAPDLLLGEVRLHIQTAVRSDILRRLLLAVIDHPEVAPRLSTTPAATGNHHAYRAGLVEHTLSMMRIASLLARHYASYYPGLIDGDLLVAGVLLHDLGKVWELEGELVTTYSTVGNLVGHIPMGSAFIERVAREIGGVPQELVWELQHLILSHHGQYEYGSPKLPATAEAQILHYIDNLDAKTNTFWAALPDDGWAQTHKLPGKMVLNAGTMRRSWANPLLLDAGLRGPGQPIDAPLPAQAHRTEAPAALPMALQGGGTPLPSRVEPGWAHAEADPEPEIVASVLAAAPEVVPSVLVAAPVMVSAPLDVPADLNEPRVGTPDSQSIARPLTLSLFNGLD
jgi:3'-5' exoribonuclease